MKRLLIISFSCMAMMVLMSASSCEDNKKTSESTPAEMEQTNSTDVSSNAEATEETSAVSEDFKDAKVLIKTKFGDMVVQLYDETPLHKANFLKLVNEHYYDDLLFHRCIKGFMIQGGDPNSKGASPNQFLGGGSPGYTIPAEFNPKFVHKKGALCAARQGDQVNPRKESSGSQFYIVQGTPLNDMQLAQSEVYAAQNMPGFKYSNEQKEAYKTIGGTPQLDMAYTVFGEVISGLNVIDSIAAQPTAKGDRPLENITMKMEIVK